MLEHKMEPWVQIYTETAASIVQDKGKNQDTLG